MSEPTSLEENTIQRFGAVLAELDAAIDWELLAPVYCEGDASGFFDEERRSAITDAGLKLASEIGEQLKPGGKSLYIGAAVAELVPMMFEAIVLNRKVAWISVEGPETKELTRAIKSIDKHLPTPRTAEWRGSDLRPRDHVWMTSVLTDPEAFPALHDKLYARQGTKQAVGGGRPKRERQLAAELVHNALAAAAQDTLLTTTDEELEVWTPIVHEMGGALEVSPTGRTSGIVGDVIRFCRLKPGR
ncbi:MAG: hypothetical protein ACJA2W_000022 [Planctomycetota bacterium]|jgi:hypothetical protein